MIRYPPTSMGPLLPFRRSAEVTRPPSPPHANDGLPFQLSLTLCPLSSLNNATLYVETSGGSLSFGEGVFTFFFFLSILSLFFPFPPHAVRTPQTLLLEQVLVLQFFTRDGHGFSFSIF